jgi:sialate O-acetylesterase
MTVYFRRLLPSLFFACAWLPLSAKIKLPSFFKNGLVLQREQRVPVWGWAAPRERVSVQFLGKTYAAQPDASGRWRVELDPTPAGGPHVLTVKGQNTITLSDVLLGDVWFCGGQSNMEWHLNQLHGTYDSLIRATPPNPAIRFIETAHVTSFTPQTDVPTTDWLRASPETLPQFSAVGYFFARELYEKYRVPIGLVAVNWGGTIAEAWMSYAGLQDFAHYQRAADLARENEKPSPAMANQKPVSWEQALAMADRGLPKTGKSWAAIDYQPTGWQEMKLPTVWEDAGLPGTDGIVWYRKTIDVKPEDAGKDVLLSLGPIDDADETFLNGTKIGATEGYNMPRRYRIPGNRVKAGPNVLAIRVIDTGGGGGLNGEADSLYWQSASGRQPLAAAWQYQLSADLKDFPPNTRTTRQNPNLPTVLHNAMLHPWLGYGLKGVIWYQGESNAGRGYEYRNLFPAMIRNWRSDWTTAGGAAGTFPFLFVQLANFMKTDAQPAESDWAELREAQLLTLRRVPNVGMATIIDIGEAADIHPRNKLDVGKRLARGAYQLAYGETASWSGPVATSLAYEPYAIRVGFDQTGTGLVARGTSEGTLRGFAIAGEDGQWHWANAKIEKGTVVVWHEQVRHPVAVRYAWGNNPEGCNLYNAEGLPASPFRTDGWKRPTAK